MLPFRKILFPVDYSEPCQAIVPYVSEMQQRFSAELSLVHAYGAEALAYSSLPITDLQLPEQARSIMDERLREFAQTNFPGLRANVFIEVGEPGAVIESVVRHQGADLVMMPTRGDAPLRRFLLGSVTAKVLHDVSAAVWTGVGSALEKHQPSVPYKSIVCALDESEEAEAVLRAAAVVAKSYKAALALDFNIYRKELIDAAHTRMRDLKTRLNLDAPDTVIDVGIPDSIHEEIVRRKAGLLVVGRGHDQGAISRVWSRLYAIVRDSPCPVLSI